MLARTPHAKPPNADRGLLHLFFSKARRCLAAAAIRFYQRLETVFKKAWYWIDTEVVIVPGILLVQGILMGFVGGAILAKGVTWESKISLSNVFEWFVLAFIGIYALSHINKVARTQSLRQARLEQKRKVHGLGFLDDCSNILMELRKLESHIDEHSALYEFKYFEADCVYKKNDSLLQTSLLSETIQIRALWYNNIDFISGIEAYFFEQPDLDSKDVKALIDTDQHLARAINTITENIRSFIEATEALYDKTLSEYRHAPDEYEEFVRRKLKDVESAIEKLNKALQREFDPKINL